MRRGNRTPLSQVNVIRILNHREKKEVERRLGYEVDGMLIKINKVMKIYTGNIPREELLKICENFNVVRIGLTFSSS